MQGILREVHNFVQRAQGLYPARGLETAPYTTPWYMAPEIRRALIDQHLLCVEALGAGPGVVERRRLFEQLYVMSDYVLLDYQEQLEQLR